MSTEQRQLLGVLAARAVDLAVHDAMAARRVAMGGGRFFALRAPSWPEIEARVFLLSRRPKRPVPPPARVDVRGSAPAWMIAAASRVLDAGGFWLPRPADGALVRALPKERRPAARGLMRKRLAVLLAVESALLRLGEGLRFGEILAATGLDERRLWSALSWARQRGALVDLGELGWFVPHSAAHSRAAEYLADRERRSG